MICGVLHEKCETDARGARRFFPCCELAANTTEAWSLAHKEHLGLAKRRSSQSCREAAHSNIPMAVPPRKDKRGLAEQCEWFNFFRATSEGGSSGSNHCG